MGTNGVTYGGAGVGADEGKGTGCFFSTSTPKASSSTVMCLCLPTFTAQQIDRVEMVKCRVEALGESRGGRAPCHRRVMDTFGN